MRRAAANGVIRAGYGSTRIRPHSNAFADNRPPNRGANSHYNGMIASVRTSNWRGITAQFNYTLGYSHDDASSVRGASPMNSFNLRQDYGYSDIDVPTFQPPNSVPAS
jgi:hypothetical protein